MSGTIALLKPDKKNRRKHNERNIGMIVTSLQTVGAARSIVIDEDNNILAGNGTVEAAQLAGIEKLRIVDADGEEIIAVRRSGLTDEQKRKLALYDNRTAELADWNLEQMLEDINAGLDFDGMFGTVELYNLMKDIRETPKIDYTAEWQGMPEFNQQDLSGYKRIIVHFMTEEDYVGFSRLIDQKLTDKTKSVWYPKRPDVLSDQHGRGKVYTDES